VRDDGVDVLAGGGIVAASAAVVAVGPHQHAQALGPGAAALPLAADAIAATGTMRFEPTATIYLGFRERVRLDERIQRLDDAPGQWVFDRNDVLARARDAATTHMLGGLLAVVISASGVHDDLDAKALAGRVHAQLRRLRPSVPMPVWTQVIVERRSTFSCTPRLRRPASAIAPRLHLAGDYLDPSLPATLESAVASGEAAARALARELGSESRR
jgi:predicted NAD/FAD-dependent oxidoreductase